MAAANTDKFRKKRSNFSTTLNGSIGSGDATITLSSTSGLPSDTGITLTIDRVDANGVSTPSARERITGIVSGSTIASALRGRDNTSAASHASGAVVEDIWDASTWNDAIDGILQDHYQLGYHKTLTDTNGNEWLEQGATASAVNQVKVSNAATGNAPTVEASGDDTNIPILVKGKGTGQVRLGQSTSTGVRLEADQPILDSSSNELIKFTKVASAVNELTVSNNATGSNPIVSATGGDTDVGIDFKMKGAGKFRRPSIVTLQAIGPAVTVTTGDGKVGFRVPAELNGMNLTGVAACVTTAGTTNTQDIQLRRVRSGSAVDMLSTKMTIDSTEVDTSSAATPAVINGSNDDVATGDQIYVDIDAVHTTPAAGTIVELRFELP